MTDITIGSYQAECVSPDVWRVTTQRLGVTVSYRTFGSREVVVERLTRASGQERNSANRIAKTRANSKRACAKAGNASDVRWAAVDADDDA